MCYEGATVLLSLTPMHSPYRISMYDSMWAVAKRTKMLENIASYGKSWWCPPSPPSQQPACLGPSAALQEFLMETLLLPCSSSLLFNSVLCMEFFYVRCSARKQRRYLISRHSLSHQWIFITPYRSLATAVPPMEQSGMLACRPQSKPEMTH